MAQVVVVGGGVVGLSAAVLIAGDGHEVTVLERDPDGPPVDAETAWEGWTRKGVNQFRQLHYFLPRFRALLDAELPSVVHELDALGALRFNVIANVPDTVTGGWRDTDDAFTALTARRPVAESAIARVADRTPNVDIRRGVAMAELLGGRSAGAGVPHVVGVRTSTGEELRGDLVIDAGGRRSRVTALLEALGARPALEDRDDSGFVYYGRYFRSDDGTTPPVFAPLLSHYGTVSILTLPADNGTWGVGIVTSARDAALRALKDPDVWTRTVRSFPLVAHWTDGTPLDDHPSVMAKIEDYRRDFVVDGVPIATGIVAVGDAWAGTNPSVGRGASIGLLHAVTLRDLLRDGSLEDPVEFARRWHDVTTTTVEPWFASTLFFDRHRLAEIDAAIDGDLYEPDDRGWEFIRALQAGGGRDPEVFRAFVSVASMLRTPEEIAAEPGMPDRAFASGGDWREQPIVGPDRDTLLAAIAG